MWLVAGGVGVGRKAVTSHFMDGFQVVFDEDVAGVTGAGVGGGDWWRCCRS